MVTLPSLAWQKGVSTGAQAATNYTDNWHQVSLVVCPSGTRARACRGGVTRLHEESQHFSCCRCPFSSSLKHMLVAPCSRNGTLAALLLVLLSLEWYPGARCVISTQFRKLSDGFKNNSFCHLLSLVQYNNDGWLCLHWHCSAPQITIRLL